ncbi:MAG: hypothetical protein ACRDXX_08790, partial [Stackebrandtia sp.]
WSRDRDVRAEALSEIATAAGDDAVAVRVRGARVVGHLNLGGRRLGVPLELRDCAFTGKVFLAKAHVPELSLRGSRFPRGISGRGLRVDGALNLTGCRFDDRLYLKRLGAEIVFMDGVKAYSPREIAVQLRGAEIAQELYCRNGFVARGRTNLYGAKIGGKLVMDGARLIYAGHTALVAPNLEVGQDLHLRHARVDGRIYLLKAKIGGDLDMHGAVLRNPDGEALRADMAAIEQNAYLNGGFRAEGQVSFYLAHVAGRLSLDGAWLRAEGKPAFTAGRAEVGQSVRFNDLEAYGEVKLTSGRVEGQVTFNHATVVNPSGFAVDARQCSVGQWLWLGKGARLDGIVDLTDARIADGFRFVDARVTAMYASELTVDFLDDDPNCWPDGSRIGGMVYQRLPEDARGEPKARIAWLRRMLPGNSPQPYTQLASIYEAIGSSSGARAVVIARETARHSGHHNRAYRAVSRAWGSVLRWTVGFGHAPWRAIPWMVGVFVAAWLIFSSAPPDAFTAPDLRPEDFRPALHALDTVLPVIEIGHGSKWTANGVYAWWEALFGGIGWFVGIVVAAGVAGVFKRG